MLCLPTHISLTLSLCVFFSYRDFGISVFFRALPKCDKEINELAMMHLTKKLVDFIKTVYHLIPLELRNLSTLTDYIQINYHRA